MSASIETHDVAEHVHKNISHGPMHQFEIHPLHGLEFSIFGIDVSITNSVLTMFAIVGILIVCLTFLVSNLKLLPTKKQSIAELMLNFIRSLISNSIASKDKNQFTAFIFSLFFFIFFSNAFGLLPYAFTITSHIAVTAVLAFLVFLLTVFIGMVKNGPISFFLALVPSGVPKSLAPFMLVIEFFTYLARPITLAVRLAVNMVAGHTMIKVIAGFVLPMGVFGIVPVLFNSLLTGFEFFVAGLQAYIFSMLVCIYINDALSHH